MIQFPIILADIEGLVGVIFFVIAFIGWIMNLSKENQQAQKRRQRPRAGEQRGKVQNEIDQFLKETKRGERRRPRRKPQEVVEEEFLSDDDIVIVEDAPRRRPPKQRQRKRVTQSGSTTSHPIPPPPPKKPLSDRAPKKPKAKRELSHIREHVEQAMPHAVDAGVQAHMGAFTAGSPSSLGQRALALTTKDRKGPAAAIIGMMRAKKRIRDAVIINEVLSKPRALR